MQKPVFLLAVLTSFLSCGPSGKSISESMSAEERMEGFEYLFNGKNTKGWHRYGGGNIDSVWKVKEGVLCFDTLARKVNNIRGNWDIVTEEEYGNFHLKLEWMISKNGNSGIMIYIQEDKSRYNWAWETAPEIQILDNAGHPDGKIPKHHAGDIFDLVACSKEKVNPPGEWNLVEIKSLAGKLDIYMNGENVISTTMWDDNWKKMIANSKFRNMAGFGTFQKGRIGLQDHGDEVCFRNIRIRKL